MKLHLPSGLRKALLACLAAVAFALPTTLSSASLGFGALAALALVQQQAYGTHDVTTHSTQENRKTYSGYIIDIKDKDSPTDDGDQFHEDTFYVNGIPDGGGTSIAGTTSGNITSNGTITQGSGGLVWQTFWTGMTDVSGTYGHTLRLGNSTNGDSGAGEHVYNFSFGATASSSGPNNLTLGGLIVEANTNGGTYKLHGSGGANAKRSINLEGANNVSVLFTIGSNTTISTDATSSGYRDVNVKSNTTFEVADGKSLTWQSYCFSIGAGKSLTVKGQGSVKIDNTITSQGWLNFQGTSTTSVAAALTVSGGNGVNIFEGAGLTLSGNYESSIGGNLNLGTGQLVLQDEGTQLTVTGDLYGYSSTSGSISGKGTLKLAGGVSGTTGGNAFTGSITGVAVEFSASANGLLSGLFAARSLTVSGTGVLTLSNVQAVATQDAAATFTVNDGGLTISGLTAPSAAAAAAASTQVYVAKEVSLAAGKTLTLGHSLQGTAAIIGNLQFGDAANLALTGGEWTLSNVQAVATREAAAATKLNLSGNGTLTFAGADGSAVALVDGVTLGLVNGITYAGGLSVVVNGAEAVANAKLEIGSDLSSLGNLTITLTGLSDQSTTWSGYDLFSAAGSGGTLSTDQQAALKRSLKSDAPREYRLTVGSDGKVTLEDYPVLTWNGGDSGSWTDSGGGWNKGTESMSTNYESNADVIFAPLNGGDTQTVTVSGTVHARDLTVGKADDADGNTKNGAAYTFSGAGATIDISGNITLAGTYGDTPSPSKAVFGTVVNFSGSNQTITGAGTVTFGDLTGNGTGLTIGSGEGSSTVVQLTANVDKAVNNNLGVVEVKAGSSLEISSAGASSDAWGASGSVWGDGSVVLRLASNNDTDRIITAATDHVLYRLLGGNEGNHRLKNLIIDGGHWLTLRALVGTDQFRTS